MTHHQHHHTPRPVRHYPLTLAWFTLAAWVTLVVMIVEAR